MQPDARSERQRVINKELKEKHPSFDFDGLEKFMTEYKTRYYRRLVWQEKRPSRLLGHNGTKFLLDCIQRSRFLFRGFVDCLNRKHCVLAYLAARAHYETTASVAYFFRNLRRLYEGEIKYAEIDNIVLRLCAGGRVFPEKSKEPSRPDAINILTQIDAVDKLGAEMGGWTGKPFRESYDLLSEFCHPNFCGLEIGFKFADLGTVDYHENPGFRDQDLEILINDMLKSCILFFMIYDKCVTLLGDNEELPKLVK